MVPNPQADDVPAPHCTVTVEPVFALPMIIPAPVAWVNWIALLPVPPWIIVVDALAVEPIVTIFVPTPVGVPLAILTVLPPATVVGLVAILIVSINPFATPVALPMLIVRAAAALMLPRLILVTRVLLPKLRVAIPAVPTPERILTVVAAAVAPLEMLIVSPAVDWPNVSEPVFAVEPMLTELMLVVPILIAPLAPAWSDNAVPPVPPWIKVCVVALVFPILTARVLVVPMFKTPPVPLVTLPESIVTEPELPLVVELPLPIVTAPLACDASPDLSVKAPELDVIPLALPERSVIAVEEVEPAV